MHKPNCLVYYNSTLYVHYYVTCNVFSGFINTFSASQFNCETRYFETIKRHLVTKSSKSLHSQLNSLLYDIAAFFLDKEKEIQIHFMHLILFLTLSQMNS